MGAYASGFQPEQGQSVAAKSTPSQPDWITAHATATGLAIVEVERLWIRFKQLGCNRDGVLTQEALTKPAVNSDVFMKNILVTMRSPDGSIAFETFLNALKWTEAAHLESKIRGVFRLFNGGYPVGRELLIKILHRTYPEDSQQSIRRVADIFMQQMDTRNKGVKEPSNFQISPGEIEESQFVDFVMSLPRDTVNALMEFHVVPQEINAEAHRAFTAFSHQSQQPYKESSRQIPTDGILQRIAEKASSRDWLVLANKLGYTSEDIQEFEHLNPADPTGQVYSMLTAWRDRERQQAYSGTLEKALRDSNMNDIAIMLHP